MEFETRFLEMFKNAPQASRGACGVLLCVAFCDRPSSNFNPQPRVPFFPRSGCLWWRLFCGVSGEGLLMSLRKSSKLRMALMLAAAVLVVKVTVAVVIGYRNYLPPNFASDFLLGREAYFFGPYRWAFYTHIAIGPFTLLAGLLLMSERFRLRWPMWHRGLGRAQVACILLLLTPSGLWMAFYAATGPIATASFSTLAFATAACAAMGWRTAVQRRFVVHRVWMWRTFLLLCSAVVLRVAGGLGTVLQIDVAWYDPVASWACWVVPLGVFEMTRHWQRRAKSISAVARPARLRSGQNSDISSLPATVRSA